MTGKSRTKIDDQRNRIVRLVNLMFDGNQTRAAQALDVSPSLISLVIAGDRKPSAKLIDKLARYPRVNPEWLIQGHGQPLLPDVAGSLPVSNALLIRAPGKETLGIWDRYPVSAAQERPSRYWLRIDEMFMDLRSGRHWGLKASDLLLIETDPEWTQKVELVTSAPCVIVESWVPRFAKLALAQVEAQGDSIRKIILVRETKVHKSEEGVRLMEQVEQSFGGGSELPHRLPAGFPEVVGVCLLLQRRLCPYA